MTDQELIRAIRYEAADCQISATKNPSPNSECFHICYIVLSNLANRLEVQAKASGTLKETND